jgi:RNA polymerase Rpb5, N-terminal domain
MFRIQITVLKLSTRKYTVSQKTLTIGAEEFRSKTHSQFGKFEKRNKNDAYKWTLESRIEDGTEEAKRCTWLVAADPTNNERLSTASASAKC